MSGRQVGRHTDRKKYRQTDRQTDRQMAMMDGNYRNDKGRVGYHHDILVNQL